MSSDALNTRTCRLLVAQGITIRAEHFGGLVFEQKSGKVRQMNSAGWRVVESALGCEADLDRPSHGVTSSFSA